MGDILNMPTREESEEVPFHNGDGRGLIWMAVAGIIFWAAATWAVLYFGGAL